MKPLRFLLVPALFALAACGITDLGEEDTGLSRNQAAAFARQVGNALSNGASGISTAPPPPADGPLAVPINVQVTHRTNCTAGGRIEVSGSLTGNIDDTGSGMLLFQLTETISDWRCITGYVMNGDPYISGAGTMAFLSGQQSSTASFSLGGGFKWGTTAAESCQMQLTTLVYVGGGGRVSGTVCGYGIDESF